MTDTPTAETTIADFVRQFVSEQPYAEINEQGEILFQNTAINMLFQRLYEKRASVLPYAGQIKDAWMIVGETQASIDILLRVVSRFLVPSYAAFGGGMPLLHAFKPTSDLGKLGRDLFAGYYRLLSRHEDRRTILARLVSCLQLIDSPETTRQIELNDQPYHILLDSFRQALATQQWEEAEQILTLIASGYLTSYENLAFLRISLLARQAKWYEIWKHPHYRQLAALSVPSAVRADMLTAFHYTCLLEPEQKEDWDGVLSELAVQRSVLGMLLIGRFGQTQPAVLRVYAYLSVLDNDLAGLERVQNAVPKDDYQTRLIVSNLREKIATATTHDETVANSAQLLQTALLHGDYESAWLHTESLVDAIEQLATRIQIAYLSHETQLVQSVVEQYQVLYDETIHELHSRYPSAREWITSLQNRVHRDRSISISNWVEWFGVAKGDADNPLLISALDQLGDTLSPMFWQNQALIDLAEYLAEISNEEYRHRVAYRSAIQRLINLCVTEDEFPRIHQQATDVYEFLLQFIVQDERNAVNANLTLRLIEAVLANKPRSWPENFQTLETWFTSPVIVFQDHMLEALELLARYGADPSRLYQWYRTWAQELVKSPLMTISALTTWKSFAQWLQIDANLLRSIQERIDSFFAEESDVIAGLSAGTQIAIFTFDDASAKRTRDILLQRNDRLKVHICTERDNNKAVQSLAQNSDYVVLVTSCISHAISYAVVPAAGERLVMPRSRGASSILQAIEDKAASALS